MKTAQILGCLLLAVVSSAIARSADSLPVLRVESSRTMNVAIINADQRNPANDRLHTAFSESLSFEISQHYKKPIPMKAVMIDAQQASYGLSNGTYDLVVVIGTDVPSILLNNDFKRFKAVPASGNAKHIVSLLVLKEDRTLATLMERSFEKALNETFFQMAFANYRKSSVERDMTQWNVAVASLQ